MKAAIVSVILFAAVSGAYADQVKLARVTVYWASGGKGSDRYTRLHKCATGARLREGHCAVDPRHIPYGSKVVLPDGAVLAAVDTGTAVKTRKAARVIGRTPNERNAIVVDRFFESKAKALAWARSHPMFQTIRVITPGTQAPAQQFIPTNVVVVKKAIAVPTRSNSTANSTRRYAMADDTVTRNYLNHLGR